HSLTMPLTDVASRSRFDSENTSTFIGMSQLRVRRGPPRLRSEPVGGRFSPSHPIEGAFGTVTWPSTRSWDGTRILPVTIPHHHAAAVTAALNRHHELSLLL